MTTSINTNVSAYFAQSNLRAAGSDSQASIGRLSSGNRIIRAADDVAGLSVGTVIRTAVNTLKAAYQNTQQANSLLQVADGGLANVTEMLQRQKSLAVQATAGTLSASERGFLNQEFQNLSAEINRMVESTKFNQVTLLDGSLTGSQANTLMSVNATVTAQFTNAGGGIASTQVMNGFRDNLAAGAAIVTYGSAAAGQFEFLMQDRTTVINANNATNFAIIPDALQGRMGQFEATSIKLGVGVDLAVQWGDVKLTGTYASGATSFIMSDGGNVNIRFGVAAVTVTAQANATTFMNNINNVAATGFGDITLRKTYEVAGINTVGTALQTVTNNMPSYLRLSDTSDTSIKNFRYSGALSANNNQLSVEVGGRIFTSVSDVADNGADQIFFKNGLDMFVVNTAGLTGITNIRTNEGDRARFIEGLNQSFTNAQGALTFQTGAAADDSIDVAIKSVSTRALYAGQSLNINSVASAQQAGAQLDIAIGYVTAIRADVGALQSRFDYAGANLQTAIQNQDAARGMFLDADISEESTAFSSSQVLMQASISVLAQANQLPQNLLKLIG